MLLALVLALTIALLTLHDYARTWDLRWGDVVEALRLAWRQWR